MITPLIITLTSDFIQHIFLITLVGLVFVEYIESIFALRKIKKENSIDIIRARQYMKAARIILIIVAMATIWFIGEYFFDNYSLTYRIFLRWPLVFLILFAFIFFMLKNGDRRISSIFSIFIVLLSIFISLDIIDYFVNSSTTAILLALNRIIAMLAFYFSFLKYFIINRPNKL